MIYVVELVFQYSKYTVPILFHAVTNFDNPRQTVSVVKMAYCIMELSLRLKVDLLLSTLLVSV